jgi:hypothetical protein
MSVIWILTVMYPLIDNSPRVNWQSDMRMTIAATIEACLLAMQSRNPRTRWRRRTRPALITGTTVTNQDLLPNSDWANHLPWTGPPARHKATISGRDSGWSRANKRTLQISAASSSAPIRRSCCLACRPMHVPSFTSSPRVWLIGFAAGQSQATLTASPVFLSMDSIHVS